jgi:hypothetical protein
VEGKLAFISMQLKENDDVRIVQPPMEHVHVMELWEGWLLYLVTMMTINMMIATMMM